MEEIVGMETGTHLLVKLHTELPDAEVKRRAQDRGIHLCCLSEFCIEEQKRYEHVLVLNYSGMEEERCRRLQSFLEECLILRLQRSGNKKQRGKD